MIVDHSIDMPKNARVFEDNKNGNIYGVHYNHVVIVISNNKIVALYPAGQTSCDVIRRVVAESGIDRYNFDILTEYNRINGTDYKKISEIYDYGYKLTGYYSPERFTKKDWNERKQALEHFDYTKGLRLI